MSALQAQQVEAREVLFIPSRSAACSRRDHAASRSHVSALVTLPGIRRPTLRLY